MFQDKSLVSRGKDLDFPPKSQLSCELCQRRKSKCDKGDPCSTCQRAGVKCNVIRRQRLPRGRNGAQGKANMDLKSRINRLESLVASLGTNASPDEPSFGDVSAQAAREIRPAGDMSQYIGSSFWSTLNSEVKGLHQVLDFSSDSESDSPEHGQRVEFKADLTGFNFLLCAPNSFKVTPDALQHPSGPMIDVVRAIFIQNVDPIFKILHGPSILLFTQEGRQTMDHRSRDAAVEALSFAIYYSAVNTQDEHACQLKFGIDKTALLNRYRFACEVWLARADFVNTVDIRTLQAFTIFLTVLIQPNVIKASVRSGDNSRWTWTLTGLAVRIAHAMGLHTETANKSLGPFQKEMRRRLWHQIGVLDLQASKDRATDPLVAEGSFNTKLPSNVNDSDLYLASQLSLREEEGFTDMTFCLMCHESLSYVRQLNFVPCNENGRQPFEMEQNWEKRQGLAFTFKDCIQKRYLRHCNVDEPFHWFTKSVGEIMSSSMFLLAVRPIQRHPEVEAPRVHRSTILSLSIQVLENAQMVYTDPRAKPWSWFVWIEWHPLAVAIAELCSQTEGNLIDRAWDVVKVAYKHYADMVADSKSGMLWRPMAKLMKKAQTKRVEILTRWSNVQPQERTEAASLLLENEALSAYPRIPPLTTEHPKQGQSANFNVPHNLQSSVIAQPNDWNTGPFAFDSNDSSDTKWLNDLPDPTWTEWETFLEDITDSAVPDPFMDL